MIAIPGAKAHHSMQEAYFQFLLSPERLWKIHEKTEHPDLEWARFRARGSLGSYHDSLFGVKSMIANMPKILESPDSSDFSYEGESAVIVAAGPSLDLVLDSNEFLEATDRCLIIATDTVYEKMLARNLRIDFVVTTERTSLTSQYFQKPKGHRLVRSLVSNPELNSVDMNSVFLLKNDVPTRFFPWEWRRSHQSGVSVSPTALSFAIGLKIQRIAFVGLDLCYHPKTFDSHCDLTYRNGDYSYGKSKEERLKKGARPVALARGGSSLTHPYWDSFAQNIESLAPQNKEFALFNCSPLARKLHGIPNIDLREFLSEPTLASRVEYTPKPRRLKEEKAWLEILDTYAEKIEKMPEDFSFMQQPGPGQLAFDCLIYHWSKAEWGNKTISPLWAQGYEKAIVERIKEDLYWIFKKD